MCSYFDDECIVCLDNFTLANPRVKTQCACGEKAIKCTSVAYLLGWRGRDNSFALSAAKKLVSSRKIDGRI